MKLKWTGYYEEYYCGCCSDTVRRKRDLLGYCNRHGEDRRTIWPEFETVQPTSAPLSKDNAHKSKKPSALSQPRKAKR